MPKTKAKKIFKKVKNHNFQHDVKTASKVANVTSKLLITAAPLAGAMGPEFAIGSTGLAMGSKVGNNIVRSKLLKPRKKNKQ